MVPARGIDYPRIGDARPAPRDPVAWPVLRAVPPGTAMARKEDDGDELDLAMSRYADGDVSAFETVYRLLAPRLLAYALRMTHSHAAAQDAVGDTLENIIRGVRGFRRGARVLPWAIAIARRVIIDDFRHAACQARLDPFNVNAYAAALLDGETPEDATERRERARAVNHALLSLPENYRDALCLTRVEGLSGAEVAAVLGTTANNVKQLVRRAKLALDAALDGKPRRT